jgi:hypothetical protein
MRLEWFVVQKVSLASNTSVASHPGHEEIVD